MKDLKEELASKKLKAKDPIEQILDEKNNDNIILFGEDGSKIEFEQVAVIPLERTGKLYAIMIPVTPMENVNQGEGVLFEIDEEKHDVAVVRDEQIIDEVLEIYSILIGEGDGEDNK